MSFHALEAGCQRGQAEQSKVFVSSIWSTVVLTSLAEMGLDIHNAVSEIIIAIANGIESMKVATLLGPETFKLRFYSK